MIEANFGEITDIAHFPQRSMVIFAKNPFRAMNA
jgi:hypothetical protein